MLGISNPFRFCFERCLSNPVDPLRFKVSFAKGTFEIGCADRLRKDLVALSLEGVFGQLSSRALSFKFS